MLYAVLQYLITSDPAFQSFLVDLMATNPLQYLLFLKCAEYCSECPVDHICLDRCLQPLGLSRCSEKEILSLNTDCKMLRHSSLFWTPWITTNTVTEGDDYGIYPFVLQNAFDAHYRFLDNDSYRDPQLKYLRKIYDHSFIVHRRYSGINEKSKRMRQRQLKRMGLMQMNLWIFCEFNILNLHQNIRFNVQRMLPFCSRTRPRSQGVLWWNISRNTTYI